jgi:hypothetical protein
MDTYQANWVFCILPMAILYSVIEIRRGWRVLRYKESSLNLNQRMHLAMVRLLRGAEAADHTYRLMMDNSEKLAFFSWSSFVGGILTMTICVAWAIFLIWSTM